MSCETRASSSKVDLKNIVGKFQTYIFPFSSQMQMECPLSLKATEVKETSRKKKITIYDFRFPNTVLRSAVLNEIGIDWKEKKQTLQV